MCQALLDLENNVNDLKAELRPLQISAAKEVDVKGGKKAIVIFVPVPQLKAFHKIQGRCVRWLPYFVAFCFMLLNADSISDLRANLKRNFLIDSACAKLVPQCVTRLDVFSVSYSSGNDVWCASLPVQCETSKNARVRVL